MCNQILVFLFLYFLNVAAGAVTPAPPSPARTGWPGYTFHPELQGWLKLHTEPTDYQDARIKCHMEDALMAAEWNLDFKEAIVKLIPSLSSQDQSQTALYSGAQLTFSDGVYKYVKGEPILTVGRTMGLELCIVFSENGTTGEVDCRQQYPFVCYAPVSACGENDTSVKYDLTCAGYKYSSQTGHCYKYNSHSVNWTTAYEACRDEGAYLAVVNSHTEAQYLKDLMPSGTNYVAIGFYFWIPAKSWWTIKGQTIDKAGFSTWKSGEPTSGAYRGFLYTTGQFYSYFATTTAPYICEKDPILTLNLSNVN